MNHTKPKEATVAAQVPYILARTLKDAHDFAKDRGFERGRYRVVNSSGTVKSVRNADLYLVPGWENRYDRFAMKSAIRWCRMNIIDVATLEEPAPVEPYGPPPVDSAIVDSFTPVSDDEVQDFFAVDSEPADPEIQAVIDDLSPAGEQLAIPVPDPEPTPEAEKPAEAKPGRRRSRCKDCGNLHYKGEPCPPAESV